MRRTLPSSNIEETMLKSIRQYDNTFVIPFFQRKYSWGKKEITELFDDLLLDFKDGISNYLLGNIILLTFDRNEYIVLDGQQRITTMMLILKEVVKYITKYPKLKSRINEITYLANIEGETIIGEDALVRVDKAGNRSNIVVSVEIIEFISTMVKEKFATMENFEEKDGIVNYLLNVTFLKQTYVATNSYNDKNEVISSILQYFIKFNTRGKRFDDTENQEAINLLKEL